MYLRLVLIFVFLIPYLLPCQISFQNPDFNLDFEKVQAGRIFPEHWVQWGNGYYFGLDSSTQHSGKYSILIKIDKTNNANGAISMSIPANYNGKQVEVRAYLKQKDVTDGQFGLVLRIDGPKGMLNYKGLPVKSIKGTTNWKQYTIKLPYPKEARAIIVGAGLEGVGELWADDFEVLIDGKNINELEPLKPKENDKPELRAEFDNEFILGSKIKDIPVNEKTVNDLIILCKVWGFLKYYHPSVAKGARNWDNELFRILPKIISCNSVNERNQVLYKWILSLGKIQSGSFKSNSKVKMKPDLSWLNKNSFSDSLVNKLNEIKNALRPEENYYVSLTKGVGNPIFKNENSYFDYSYNFKDQGYNLLSLFRYWNIIQYYYPYRNLISKDWESILSDYMPKFITVFNELDYKLCVLSMISEIHDTHANISKDDNTIEKYYGYNRGPYELKFIQDKAVVTGYYDSTEVKRSRLRVGDIIEKINNENINDIVIKKLPISCGSNYSTQLRNISKLLFRTNDTVLRVEFLRGDSIMNTMIHCSNPSYFKDYKYLFPDTCFKIINKNIAYIYPGKLNEKDINKLWPYIEKTDGLIIDFRCYPSDFFVFSLGNYLMPKAKDFVRFSIGNIQQPGLFTYSNTLKVGNKNKNRYKGKIIILVNETTQSSAEYHVMAFRVSPGAKVIGSTTAGADGNVSQFFLPGGISTKISGIGVYYPDGTETQRVGIIPDIEVKPTIKGIKEVRDEVLEKAIELINKR
jgi:C-terminal processing protease CtpA/Prc